MTQSVLNVTQVSSPQYLVGTQQESINDCSSDGSTAQLRPLNSTTCTNDLICYENNSSDDEESKSISSGSREHTIPLKPATSTSICTGYISSGNSGTSGDSNSYITNIIRNPADRSYSRIKKKPERIKVIVNVYDLHRYNAKLYPIGLGLYHTGVHVK